MVLSMIYLQQAAAQGGSGLSFIIMMVLIFVVMWFFMIRPQQKRQKELNNFRNSLETGQKVITAGGIYGKIKEVKDTYVLLEIDNNVHIRVDKTMIMKDPTDLPQQEKEPDRDEPKRSGPDKRIIRPAFRPAVRRLPTVYFVATKNMSKQRSSAFLR